MSNKKEALVHENLKELSDRIGLLIKQYNLLAESEGFETRRLFVVASINNVDVNESNVPKDIYDIVTDYNDAQGWSSSQSCW